MKRLVKFHPGLPFLPNHPHLNMIFHITDSTSILFVRYFTHLLPWMKFPKPPINDIIAQPESLPSPHYNQMSSCINPWLSPFQESYELTSMVSKSSIAYWSLSKMFQVSLAFPHYRMILTNTHPSQSASLHLINRLPSFNHPNSNLTFRWFLSGHRVLLSPFSWSWSLKH